MKKIFLAIILISSFMLLTNCGSSNKSVANTEKKEEITLTGKLTSLQGVMDILGCYCYKVGYLTIENNSIINVCFDNLSKPEDLKSVSKVTLTGYYDNITINTDVSGNCTTGTRNFLL